MLTVLQHSRKCLHGELCFLDNTLCCAHNESSICERLQTEIHRRHPPHCYSYHPGVSSINIIGLHNHPRGVLAAALGRGTFQKYPFWPPTFRDLPQIKYHLNYPRREITCKTYTSSACLHPCVID